MSLLPPHSFSVKVRLLLLVYENYKSGYYMNQSPILFDLTQEQQFRLEKNSDLLDPLRDPSHNRYFSSI